MTPWLDDGDVRLHHGDALEQLALMPSESVQCIVTSPPFWGLRSYIDDDHVDKPLEHGLEETPELWCSRLVAVMREARRVLRSDGVCWIEVGDTYNASPGQRKTTDAAGAKQQTNNGSTGSASSHDPNLKPKDLVGAPWLLAFALRADGWYLRSDTIWARPNPMPESVTDRPTKSHSYVFLMTKSARYYYDADAIREPHTAGNLQQQNSQPKKDNPDGIGRGAFKFTTQQRYLNPAGRNARSVWSIATQPTPFAHFATFPEELVARCIKAGTSEHGACSECGAPWRRITETSDDYRALLVERYKPEGIGAFLKAARLKSGMSMKDLTAAVGAHGAVNHGGAVSNWEAGNNQPTADQWSKLKATLGFGDEMDEAVNAWHEYERGAWTQADHADGFINAKSGPAVTRRVATLGWEPSCDHDAPVRPCVVLDPFSGSGTTALVARRLGRHAIGIELNLDYLRISATRLQQLSLLGGTA